MKHVHFIQSADFAKGGGIASAAMLLHEGLLQLGDQSRLVGGLSERPHAEDVPRGVDIVTLAGPKRFYYSPELKPLAARLVTPDAHVHGHGLYVYPNYVFGKLARERGAKLIYHPHGVLEPWVRQRSRGKKAVLRWLFEGENFRRIALWRALTTKEADQIRDFGTKAPIVVVPNGIDTQPFAKPPTKPKTGRRKLLFLGRLHQKKGLDLLLRAWATLKSERQDWELHIVGPDEAGCRLELDEIIRTEGLSDSVSFGPPVGGAEKVEIYQSASLFILPSRSEGFSMAILEAMAAGLPILATHACNFPDIQSAGFGWLSDSTVEGVVSLLREAFAASDTKLAAMGETGRAIVNQRYTFEAIGRQMHDAIASTLSV